MGKEASFYVKKPKNIVKCFLCPHGCVISPGNKGICRVRKNNKGVLEATNYGLCTAIALDPIEKKPLKNFYSGSNILSVGTMGCNLQCSYCQNWQIAHEANPQYQEVTAERLLQLALKYKRENSIGIAYTYSEPLMWYEFVSETAQKIQREKLKNVLVTNGYIEEEPLRELLPYIDGANIDVKAFNNTFYPELCKGKLHPVKRTVEVMAEDCHIEITTLIIPKHNDDLEEIESLAQWIAQIFPQIPLHLSRYFPNYKLNIPPTPKETLLKAQEVASKYLDTVYVGNV